MEKQSRKNVYILSFALVVVMLGFGMVIPIFPFYIEEMGGGGSELGLLVAIAALLEFLCAPVWGSISDRVGRKPILLIGMLGYGISSLLMGLSTGYWALLASRALSGVLSSATSAAAMAYVGDSTSEDDRGGGMGILGAASGLGLIVGPGIGGLLGTESLSLPFFLAAGFSLLALILIAWCLPESLPREARSARGRFKVVQLRAMWQALSGPIGFLLVLLCAVSFGLSNFEAVFGLYTAEKLGYGPERVGAILVVVGVVSTIGKATLIGPLTKRWGEAVVIKGSLLASTFGFLILLPARTYPAVLLATGMFILSKTLLRTSIISLASKRAAVGQGVTMGLSNAFMSLGRIAGPIWAGAVFDVDVNYPYLSGAAIMLIGFLVSLAWVKQGSRARAEACP
ncbi:MAG: MFS transporter [Anaerolineae bacterium]|nr:MFS transporter [Anaerolineae bacterium]